MLDDEIIELTYVYIILWHLSRRMTKSTKWQVRPAKTQSSLFAVAWRNLVSLADAQADLSRCWAQRSFCWFCHAQAHFFSLRSWSWMTCILSFVTNAPINGFQRRVAALPQGIRQFRIVFQWLHWITPTKTYVVTFPSPPPQSRADMTIIWTGRFPHRYGC